MICEMTAERLLDNGVVVRFLRVAALDCPEVGVDSPGFQQALVITPLKDDAVNYDQDLVAF